MPDFSEQEMRNYLLGGLAPERQTELAAQIQANPDVQEEFFALKEELFDQYLAGSLTEAERQHFQLHSLSTESGQKKLHFARLFQEYCDGRGEKESVAANRVPAPNTPEPASRPRFRNLFQNPYYALPMIVIVALLATPALWLFTDTAPKPASSEAATHSGATLVLTAGSTNPYGSITHLRAPAKTGQVKVELELTQADFKKYKTQLFRENQAVESQEELKSVPRNAHYVIPVTFAAVLLTPGDYQLKLSGVPDSGQPTFIDSYAFRVTEDSPSDSDFEPERDRLSR